jgi:hypothetical protein
MASEQERFQKLSIPLERTHEKKKRLVTEGEIKKDKNESFISKRDNHYYDDFFFNRWK